ncbi:Flp pilus assembly protein CpaB [Xylophilus sp. GW821-FHT01B05]
MLKKIKLQSLASNPWLLLALAVVVAGALTFSVYRYLSGREAAMRDLISREMGDRSTVAVIVPSSDAPAGSPINANGFSARDVPADLVFDDVLRATDFETVSQSRLVRPVRRGQPLRRADVEALRARDFSDSLPVGKRALTIDIDPLNSAASMLRPGNHIDLFLISNTGGTNSAQPGQSSRLLLSDLAVLATGQDVRARDFGEAGQQGGETASTGHGGYDTLTLQVTPEQAGRIALAQKIGGLRAVLRNQDDKAATPPVVVSENALFGPDDGPSIEYIIGGTGKQDPVSKVPAAADLGKVITAALTSAQPSPAAPPATPPANPFGRNALAAPAQPAPGMGASGLPASR